MKIMVLVLMRLLETAAAGLAATLTVEMTGVDSPTCGAATSPCRTINWAVQHAAPGDKIVVGPGWYREVHSADCAAYIDIGLTIVSRKGALLTGIEADPSNPNAAAVCLNATGIVLGKKRKGFTVTGHLGVLATANGEVVEGNLASGCLIGFRALSSGDLFKGNVAVGNTTAGFESDGPLNTFDGNVATGGEDGFDDGISATGGQTTYVRNVAMGNSNYGLDLFQGSTYTVTGNAFLGNDSGILVSSYVNDATINGCNLFGNYSNCGIVTTNGSTLIDATGNFWGLASGPGSDPADFECTTVVPYTPVATKQFSMKAPKL